MSENLDGASEYDPEGMRASPPDLLVQWESPARTFLSNLAHCLRLWHSPEPLGGVSGTFWADIFIPRQSRVGGIFSSMAIHAAFAGLLLSVRDLPHNPRIESPIRHTTVVYYSVSEFLPALAQQAPPITKTLRDESARTKLEEPHTKPEPTEGKQQVISVAAEPDKMRQTLVTPVRAPIPHLTPLPNMVTITAKPILEAPPPVLEPPQVPKSRQAHTDETTPPKVNLSLKSPELVQKAALPATPASTSIGEVEIAKPPVMAKSPKLPLKPQSAAQPEKPQEPLASARQTPALPSETPKAPALLALSTMPAEVHGPIQVPLGTRQDTFATAPHGRADVPHLHEKNSDKAEPHDSDTAVSAKVISPAPASAALPASPGVMVAGTPSRSATPTLSELMARARVEIPRPSTATSKPSAEATLKPEPGSVDARIFGRRGYYSLTVNMPNLTSAVGTWEIHFSELSPTAAGSKLRAPVPLNKADPAYPTELMRNQVEGMVVLYAVIRDDGSVGEIRVLNSVDQRLDSNAAQALAKWHFEPATRDGRPVSVEAVVKVPFRVRKFKF